MNNRGLSTVGLFVMIVMILASALTVGILLFTFQQMGDALDQDVVVTTDGDTLSDLNSVTFKVFSNALISNADYIGMGLVFGMVLLMFVSAFFLRGSYPTLFIVVDIFLMIGAYIMATYIAYTYQILINSDAYLSFFIDHMPKTSTFVLYLHAIIAIVGVITMVITYSMFPSDEQAPSIRGGLDYEGAY